MATSNSTAHQLLLFLLLLLSGDLWSTTTTTMTRFVGADPFDAADGEFPYFVDFPSILFEYSLCGGVLIAPDIALTAASCNDRTGQQISIGVDVTRTCAEWIPHPLYVDTYKQPYSATVWDVALCKLDAEVNLDDPSAILELDRDGDISIAGEGLYVLGCRTGSTCADILQKGLVVGQECDGSGSVPPLENYVCAESAPTCYGDDGGPLVKIVPSTDGGPDTHYLVGMVVEGSACYEYYGRMSIMVPWIDQTMCELNSIGAVNCDADPPDEVECPNPDQSKLLVSFFTDPFAHELEWVLDHFFLDEWVQDGQNSLDIGYGTYEDVYCLEPDATYRWTVTDSYGDGLCWAFQYDNPCGNYSLTVNGEEIFSSEVDDEGNLLLGFDDYVVFETPNMPGGEIDLLTLTPTSTPTGAPTMSPTCSDNDLATVNVTVVTNTHPEDNDWTLEIDDDDNEWLEIASNNNLEEENFRYVDIICVELNRSFRWTLTDSNGDGLQYFNTLRLRPPGSFSVALDGIGMIQDVDFDFEVSGVFDTNPLDCSEDASGFWYFVLPGGRVTSRKCKVLKRRIEDANPQTADLLCNLPLTNGGTIADKCVATCADIGIGPCA